MSEDAPKVEITYFVRRRESPHRTYSMHYGIEDAIQSRNHIGRETHEIVRETKTIQILNI